MGNASIGDWDYVGTINQSIVTVFGGAIVHRATQVKLVNTNLVWETKETVNIGFDASFLNSRLTFSAEYYHSKTKDVLTEMPIAISTGNQEGAPKANAASLRNRGFELSLGWKDQVSDFKYGALLNITTLSNKVLSLGYEKPFIDSGQARTRLNGPLAEFFCIKPMGFLKHKNK